jgi:hypothetical protein
MFSKAEAECWYASVRDLVFAANVCVQAHLPSGMFWTSTIDAPRNPNTSLHISNCLNTFSAG